MPLTHRSFCRLISRIRRVCTPVSIKGQNAIVIIIIIDYAPSQIVKYLGWSSVPTFLLQGIRVSAAIYQHDVDLYCREPDSRYWTALSFGVQTSAISSDGSKCISQLDTLQSKIIVSINSDYIEGRDTDALQRDVFRRDTDSRDLTSFYISL